MKILTLYLPLNVMAFMWTAIYHCKVARAHCAFIEYLAKYTSKN